MSAFKATFDEFGNPFSESSSDLLVLDTRDVVDKEVVDTVQNRTTWFSTVQYLCERTAC